MLPGENRGEALEKFFVNTLDRNGRGQRPDVHVPVPAFGTGRSEISDLNGDYDSFYGGLQYGQRYHDGTLSVSLQPYSNPSQMGNKSVRDALALSVRGNWNMFHRKGTDAFVPALSLCNPNASQLHASTLSVRKTWISRGTGTYIPDMVILIQSSLLLNSTSALFVLWWNYESCFLLWLVAHCRLVISIEKYIEG